MDRHPPRPETLADIERALAERHRASQKRARWLAQELHRRREEIEARIRRDSRRRPPGMAPALVEPPRGPLPLAGGAEAPLDFSA